MSANAPAISVRAAQISDAGDIASLAAQLGYEVDIRATTARLGRILPQSMHHFMMAELEGRPVGWIHATVWEYVETGAFVAIGGLVVDRSVRGRGIGRILMREVEAWAVEQGCTVVRLWSSIGRTEAHRFYEHLGYANIKTQHSFAKTVDPRSGSDFRGFVPRIEQ